MNSTYLNLANFVHLYPLDKNSITNLTYIHMRVEGHLNPRVEKLTVEKSGLKGPGLKLGVEKSRVEMSFNPNEAFFK